MKWAFLENCVLYICASLLAYYVSAWCLLMLLFVTTKVKTTIQKEDEK